MNNNDDKKNNLICNIIFYIGIFCLFLVFVVGAIKTYAYENFNTAYNIEIPNYKEQLQQKVCGNTNAYDFINDIINSVDFSSSYYQLNIFPENTTTTNFVFTFIPSSFINSSSDIYPYALWPKGRYVSNAYTQYQLYLQSTYNSTGSFLLYFNNCASNTDLSTLKQNLINYINNNTNFYYVNSNVGIFNDNSTSTSIAILGRLNPYSINNNTSYTTNVWYYYSSFKYKYIDFDYSSSSFYYKTVNLVNEEKSYGVGDTFDSYYDLYVNDTANFIGYGESLKTFYTNLDPINISNYNLKVSFNVPQSLLGYYQTPQEYIDNTRFNYYCSGRIDNTDYYSYEFFPCSITSSYSLTSSKIIYTFNNITTSQSLSNYDKLYVTIQPIYLDSNISTTIFNLGYTFNQGNFFNTDYKGIIYENFRNLPLNFSMYFSSNNSIVNADLYVKYYSFIDYGLKFIGFSNNTYQQNLVIGQSILGTSSDENFDSNFIKAVVTNYTDSGIMIYQKDSSINLMNLDLFFNNGMIISFNNNSNEFYFIDSNGDIQNGNFVKPISDDSLKYDISYYVGIVNDFINDLSEDTLQLSLLTQEFYNSLPLAFQSFIFVLFILSCVYFVYSLIKKE